MRNNLIVHSIVFNGFGLIQPEAIMTRPNQAHKFSRARSVAFAGVLTIVATLVIKGAKNRHALKKKGFPA
ncbi:hypothetical protein [Acetobacter pomorum]|uniref:hypothetical protein n=1 Tax=Acetobacter pomorum TaxID=65959 RepID=UPI0011786236|nr:hypothetical protein [Acetobacter pomorum]